MVEHRRSPLNSIIAMKSVKLESPAKINLMLSVHRQRYDGFHALTSVVAPLVFGDTLIVSPSRESASIIKSGRAYLEHAGKA